MNLLLALLLSLSSTLFHPLLSSVISNQLACIYKTEATSIVFRTPLDFHIIHSAVVSSELYPFVRREYINQSTNAWYFTCCATVNRYVARAKPCYLTVYSLRLLD